MTENMGKWPSGHGQITKIWPSDHCGGTTIPTAMQFECDRHEFEGYLGNIGLAYRNSRPVLPAVPANIAAPLAGERLAAEG